MSDVTLFDPPPAPAPVSFDHFDPTGGRLVAWAQSLSAAHKIALALSSTTFCPQHFRGKPDDAAAAILYGDEIGLTPTAALRSIFVISGTPGLYARTMAALVLSKGHEVWTVEESAEKVTVSGRRKGSSHEESSSWTIARARTAGYTNNAQYTKNPQNMLYARALGDVVRRIAPDVISGIAYTAEELELDAPAATTTVTRDPSATRKVSRKRPEPVAVEEPEFDEPAPADRPVEEPATRPQVTALNAAVTARGITERDAKLAFLSQQVGRELSSSSDLTLVEASAVIKRLTDEAEAQRSEPVTEEPPVIEGWAQ